MNEVYEDIVVIGGGMSGICAAVAAARRGCRVALVQDRPVLGGNASSEVRMHIVGATRHGKRENLRETGLIEEILLENKYRNPEHSYGLFDTILWEVVRNEPTLTLYLNTYIRRVEMDGARICAVIGEQSTTEKALRFSAKIFIDCTGDGSVAFKAGAGFMLGRESREQFGEPNAVEHADRVTMGNSIQFRSLDAGHPVSFVRPEWAYDYAQADWAKRQSWVEITSGYWWLELGGTELDCVADAELTRDEMLRILFGIWDYIKNHSARKKEAESLYLDWVSFLPAKRESRRIIGDYVLTENDVLENRRFPDAIAYGGWHLDSHRPEGFYAFIHNRPQNEDKAVLFDGIYTIPYRSIYARDVENLYIGGRILSASHRAFSSSRVMATCAVEGEACGVAAALAVQTDVLPRAVDVAWLQQELLKNGCYIPGVRNTDENDLARHATTVASSYEPGAPAENVINGIARPEGENSNLWRAGADDKQPWIILQFDTPCAVKTLLLTFGADWTEEIMISLSHWHHVRQNPGVPATLVRDFTVEYLLGGTVLRQERVRDNHQRRYILHPKVQCDAIRITVESMHGDAPAAIAEVRVYA